jgi:hypothetical protein
LRAQCAYAVAHAAIRAEFAECGRAACGTAQSRRVVLTHRVQGSGGEWPPAQAEGFRRDTTSVAESFVALDFVAGVHFRRHNSSPSELRCGPLQHRVAAIELAIERLGARFCRALCRSVMK